MGTVAVIIIKMKLIKCWLKHSPFLCLFQPNYNKNHHFCFMTAKLKLHQRRRWNLCLKRKWTLYWKQPITRCLCKKMDAFVLGLLSLLSLSDWIFIFLWQFQCFFGKNITQSKSVSSPLFTKTVVTQAEGSRNESKGRNKGKFNEPLKTVITQKKMLCTPDSINYFTRKWI